MNNFDVTRVATVVSKNDVMGTCDDVAPWNFTCSINIFYTWILK